MGAAKPVRTPDEGWLRAHLFRRRREPPAPEPLTAFVLAGGGSRGAVQVGMLAELTARGIRADRVFGASVGAVNGAAYCADPTPAGCARLEEVWRGLSGDQVFPRSRVFGPWLYFQHRPSVHSNAGLREIVESGAIVERLEDLSVPLEIVVTSLSDGQEHWLSKGSVVDAVLASSAIPAIFPPVTVDGDLMIDGGVVDNVPISRAIAAGANRIYVLLCGPIRYRPLTADRPVEAVLSAFFVAIHARFARELAQVPEGVTVTVFAADDGSVTDYRDFSNAAGLIAAGREEVASVLEGRGGVEAGRRTEGGDHPDDRFSQAAREAMEATGATEPSLVPGAPEAEPEGPGPDGSDPQHVGGQGAERP